MVPAFIIYRSESSYFLANKITTDKIEAKVKIVSEIEDLILIYRCNNMIDKSEE